MESGRKRPEAACFCVILLISLVLRAGSFAAERNTTGFAPGGGACQLHIQGSHIARLTLENRSGQIRQIARPHPRLSLPAGTYRVRQVDLKGGYRFTGSSAPDPGWFTLSPETPHQLKVGAPLTPSVKVARWGRVLTLDYQLLDAGGRVYRGGQSISRPRFSVYRGDREIGSGSFAYG